MANIAPRILNDPVNCSDSSFNQTGTPRISESPEEYSTGVRRTFPHKYPAASRISSIISVFLATGYWLLALKNHLPSHHRVLNLRAPDPLNPHRQNIL